MPDRRAQIIAAATQLFFDKGIALTSMVDIADVVGIKKASLYYFFDAKEDLVYQVLAPGVRQPYLQLRAIVAGDATPSEKLVAAARALGGCFDEYPQIMACLVRERLDRHLTAKAFQEIRGYKRRYTRLWEQIVADGIETGDFKPATQHTVVFALLGSLNWMYAWYDPHGSLSASEYATEWMSLVLSGLEPGEVPRLRHAEARAGRCRPARPHRQPGR